MLFLTDLDRTLIFSCKRLSEDNICVEEKDGKKLSFMTPASAEMLKELIKKAEFIPVTTRSMEQYKRIVFPYGISPRYAVTDNGGNLLINGRPDPEWRGEISGIISAAREELMLCAEFLKSRPEVYFEVRFVDETFIFTRSHTPAETLSAAREHIKPCLVSLHDNGDKIYAIPDGINKGAALDMLRKRLGGEIVAAGDSAFDREMLRRADIAVIKGGELAGERINPRQYAEDISPNGGGYAGEAGDPDFTLRTVIDICGDSVGK